jgi:hypothetical protein
MSQVIRPIRQVLLALGVFTSLGFGVSSALAEPVQRDRAICTFLRDPDECIGCCQTGGYSTGIVFNDTCYCES